MGRIARELKEHCERKGWVQENPDLTMWSWTVPFSVKSPDYKLANAMEAIYTALTHKELEVALAALLQASETLGELKGSGELEYSMHFDPFFYLTCAKNRVRDFAYDLQGRGQ